MLVTNINYNYSIIREVRNILVIFVISLIPAAVLWKCSMFEIALLYVGWLFMTINEAEDLCVRGRFFISRPFFNSTYSWKNKWKLKEVTLLDKDFMPTKEHIVEKNNDRLWYYLWLYRPEYKEAFPYSSTILVWLTDGEHLFQELKLFVLCLLGGFCGEQTIGGVYGFLYCFLGIKLAGTIKELLSTMLKKPFD